MCAAALGGSVASDTSKTGYVASVEIPPAGITVDCSYRLHRISDVIVRRGIVIAPRESEVGRLRVMRTWEQADAWVH